MTGMLGRKAALVRAGSSMAGTALLMAVACSAPLPVSELTAQQAATVAGYPEVSLADAGFTTSTLVDVAALAHGTQMDVQREADATAASYAGLSLPYPIQPPPGPAPSAPPDAGSHIDFKKGGDSGQGWATTTGAGMPFLDLTSFGQASARGTASWTAHVPIGPTDTNLYVQFHLPAAQVTGFTEQNGPSVWQDRLRAELLMNGHPVWSTEAQRMTALGNPLSNGGDNCINDFEASDDLVVFGPSLGLVSDPGQKSPPKTVTLWMGSFPPNQTVELSLIVRGETQVERPCCNHAADGTPEEFCTRATLALDWDETPQPVRFWVGPSVF
jgi:hypothetical protein